MSDDVKIEKFVEDMVDSFVRRGLKADDLVKVLCAVLGRACAASSTTKQGIEQRTDSIKKAVRKVALETFEQQRVI